ncbi:MAG: general stress protein, partial [Isosphaeraceae bacterium]
MKTIVGMFETRNAAEDAIQRLMAAGIHRDAIGVALRDSRESADLAEETGTGDLAAEGATAGALSGAGVGALIGLALVGSTIVLPGIGPILIGGALAAGGTAVVGGATAAALAGAGIGAASGGLLGGLIGAGVPEDEATDYAQRIEHGHVLVSVHADDDQA